MDDNHSPLCSHEIAPNILLEDGFDFGIDGDVRGGKTVDGVALGAGFFGEIEKTTDVVVLVEAGEETVCFFDRKTKLINRDGIAEGLDKSTIALYELRQGEKRRAAWGFGTHGGSLVGV